MKNYKHGKYIVYALIDPRNNEIRYVGMSTNGLVRPKKHLMPSSYNNKNKKHYHVYNWIRKLISLNLKPEIKVLESCSKENLYKREQYYILNYKEIGCNLTNKVDGGPGMLGLKHSEETKKKLSIKGKNKKVPEKTLKMFRNQKGKNHPMYGKKHSEESLKKMRESHLGYKMPEEQKKKISNSLKGRKYGPVSEGHREKLIKAKKNKMKPIICLETGEKFESINDACRKLNLNKNSIRKVINGKWKKTKGLTFSLI